MSIEGQCHFFTIYFSGFVCFMLYLDKISGERLQDHWSSGFVYIDDMQMIYSYIGPFSKRNFSKHQIGTNFCTLGHFKSEI